MNKKSIMIVGPALSRSGYGEQTRFAIESLKRSRKYDLFLYNTGWGNSNWLPHNDPSRNFVDKLIKKTVNLKPEFRADISLQVGMPSDFKLYSEINIGYTAAAETDKVDREWLVSANMMSGLITPSNHSKSSFKNSKYGDLKLTTDCKVVNFPYTLNRHTSDNVKSPRMLKLLNETATKYNFLSVSQVSPRKNIYNLIAWFLQEFGHHADKSLYLKLHRKDCSTIDRVETMEKVRLYANQVLPNRKCGLHLIHGDLPQSELCTLYQSGHITHYLNTSHGEGFGLPLFDAAASGLVIVSHIWSGEADYLEGNNIALVPHSVEKVSPSAIWPGVINADASWAKISKKSFRSTLADSVQNYEFFKKKAKILSRKVKKKFTIEKQSFIFNQSIEDIIKKGEKIYVKQNNY